MVFTRAAPAVTPGCYAGRGFFFGGNGQWEARS